MFIKTQSFFHNVNKSYKHDTLANRFLSSLNGAKSRIISNLTKNKKKNKNKNKNGKYVGLKKKNSKNCIEDSIEIILNPSRHSLSQGLNIISV